MMEQIKTRYKDISLRYLLGNFVYVSNANICYFVGSSIYVYLGLWDLKASKDINYDWSQGTEIYYKLGRVASIAYLMKCTLDLNWYIEMSPNKGIFRIRNNVSTIDVAGALTFCIGSTFDLLSWMQIYLRRSDIVSFVYVHFCFLAGLFWMISYSKAAAKASYYYSSYRYYMLGIEFFFVRSSIDVFTYHLFNRIQITTRTKAWAYLFSTLLSLGASMASILSDAFDDDDEEDDDDGDEHLKDRGDGKGKSDNKEGIISISNEKKEK